MYPKKLLYLILGLIWYGNLSAQHSIDTSYAVKIGEIDQWIRIQGKDRSAPLLLFLHGGPGFSSMIYSGEFTSQLKNHFLVVEWDQRASGTTLNLNPQADTLTYAQFVNDTHEVILHLLKKFSRERLFLTGFSWGGFLGLNIAHQYPELLEAYISVSSMINNEESEKLLLERNMHKAKEGNNKKAIREISQITIPFQTWEDIYYQRKWMAFFNGNKASSRAYPKKLFQHWASTMKSPLMSLINFNR